MIIKRMNILGRVASVMMATLLPLTLSAQLSQGGLPLKMTTPVQKVYRLPDAGGTSVQPSAELGALIESCVDVNQNVGALRTLNLNTLTHVVSEMDETWGAWSMTDDGSDVWVGSIEWPGAAALVLFFDRFDLAEGDRLYIQSADGRQCLGAYTSANHTALGSLSVQPVVGSRLYVQYEPAAGRCSLPFALGDVTAWIASERATTVLTALRGAGEPWMTLKGLDCADNVIAHPAWSEQSRSNVLMVVRGGTVCSGSLINNARNDGKAYVLTSSHCMNGNFRFPGNRDYAQKSAESTIFFFNFYSPVNDRFYRGIETQSLAGARLIAIDESIDMCLLEITGIDESLQTRTGCGIPRSYMPFFGGWSRSVDIQTPCVTLHHPLASVMRYTESTDAVAINDFNAGQNLKWTDSHWLIDEWHIGTTAGGSSGAPLYDQEGYVIGALTGGSSYCDRPYKDAFWSLSRAWDKPNGAALQAALSPDDKNLMKCRAYDPYGKVPTRRYSYLWGKAEGDHLSSPVAEMNVQAVATSYQVRVESVVEAVSMVIDKTTVFDGTVLQLYKGSNLKPETLLLERQLMAPTYTVLNGSSFKQLPQSLDMPMHVTIDLSDDSIKLAKNEWLYIGLRSADGGSLTMPVLATDRPVSINPVSWVSENGSKWSQMKVAGGAKLGAFWLDALLTPLNSMDAEVCSPSVEVPTLVRTPDVLLLILPDDWASDMASMYVFSDQGQCMKALAGLGRENYFMVSDLMPARGNCIITVYRADGKRHSIKVHL